MQQRYCLLLCYNHIIRNHTLVGSWDTDQHNIIYNLNNLFNKFHTY